MGFAGQVCGIMQNLQYFPQSASLNEGGGAVTVNGSIDFVDKDGDIVKLFIRGNSGSESIDIQGASGLTSGTIAVVAVVDTTTAGNFPFDVEVSDATNKLSNTLTGSFTVN